MNQPPGYEIEGSAGKVCHLLKTLYSLKQSGRRWYQKLVEILVGKLRFQRCSVDEAVFFRYIGEELMVILVHVDDCTIASNSLDAINIFKTSIQDFVEITDLSELHWLLGLEIQRNREKRTLGISQRAYIDSILRRHNFHLLKPVSIPMETTARLSTSQSPQTTAEIAIMRDKPYRKAVGELTYASLATRPDITFAVQVVSRFLVNPGVAHWDAVERIFRYLLGTKELWLGE